MAPVEEASRIVSQVSQQQRHLETQRGLFIYHLNVCGHEACVGQTVEKAHQVNP